MDASIPVRKSVAYGSDESGGVLSDWVISVKYDLDCLTWYSNSFLYIKKKLIK
jgi:hypothetical protein